jgi:pilus assembly protein Flp/PilA
MFEPVKRFLRNSVGATAIEYAIIAAGIAVVIVAALQLLSGNISTVYSSIASSTAAP